MEVYAPKALLSNIWRLPQLHTNCSKTCHPHYFAARKTAHGDGNSTVQVTEGTIPAKSLRKVYCNRLISPSEVGQIIFLSCCAHPIASG